MLLDVVISADRCILLHGDAADLGDYVSEHAVDAIVCDPPAGIGFMGKPWDGDKGGRRQWAAWLTKTLKPSYEALKPGGHALVWALPRTCHWTMCALEDLGFEIRDVVSHLFGTGFPKSLNVSKAIDKAAGAKRTVVGVRPDAGKLNKTVQTAPSGWVTGPRDPAVTAPATPEARQWQGFGTALKPAAEFWILCRKPLSEKTIAANVLRWGTGALNIDGCRLRRAPGDRTEYGVDGDEGSGSVNVYNFRLEDRGAYIPDTAGRWPANVVLDEDAAVMVDAQSGTSKSTKGRPRKGRPGNGYGLTHTGAEYNDRGGASRFFYVAKPARKERDEGLGHLVQKTGGEATGRVDGSAGTKNPRAGAGRTGGARNFHPTVKSIALMSWLIRLITPPGGIVLDPFAGSGTTGVAALKEGFLFVGVEITDEYIPIIEGRLQLAIAPSAS